MAGQRFARAAAIWRLPRASSSSSPRPGSCTESWQFGAAFWRTIFGVHVFQRFTSGVDAAHLQPWWYYLTATWEQARLAGSALLITAGLARLAVAALRGESWLARVVLLWAVVPMAAISIGTSKLVHYAFPFWPPIALGAGSRVRVGARGGAPAPRRAPVSRRVRAVGVGARAR